MERKLIRYTMRALHRDIGFLVIGITIILTLSGVSLIYRDTNFLKKVTIIERQLEPDLEIGEIGQQLHLRDFKVEKTEGNIVFFNNGTYNSSSGLAVYTAHQLPVFINKINAFHKTVSKNAMHWFLLIYAFLLLFLAISSFWMFSPGSKSFKRGLILSVIGIVISLLIFLV